MLEVLKCLPSKIEKFNVLHELLRHVYKDWARTCISKGTTFKQECSVIKVPNVPVLMFWSFFMPGYFDMIRIAMGIINPFDTKLYPCDKWRSLVYLGRKSCFSYHILIRFQHSANFLDCVPYHAWISLEPWVILTIKVKMKDLHL